MHMNTKKYISIPSPRYAMCQVTVQAQCAIAGVDCCCNKCIYNYNAFAIWGMKIISIFILLISNA